MRPDDRNAMSMDALLTDFVRSSRVVSLSALLLLLITSPATAQLAPVLNTVFPCGGQIGTAFEVSVAGSHLESVETLRSNVLVFRTPSADPPPWGKPESGRQTEAEGSWGNLHFSC